MMQFYKVKEYNLQAQTYGLKQTNKLEIKWNVLFLIFQQFKVTYFVFNIDFYLKIWNIILKEKSLFGLVFKFEDNNSFLYPYVSEGQSGLKYECKDDEWKLLVITFQSEVFIKILSSQDHKHQEVNFQYSLQNQIQYQDLIVAVINSSDIIDYQDLFVYYNQLNQSLDSILLNIVNIATKIKDCRMVEQKKDPHYQCSIKKYQFQDQNSMNYTLTTKNKSIIIISFNLIKTPLSQNISYNLFKFDVLTNLLIQKENNKLFLYFELNGQNYLIGIIDNLQSQIALQIQYDQLEYFQYSIQFYEDEKFKGETKIKKMIPLFNQNFQDFIEQKQSEELLFTNIMLIDNYKIVQIHNKDQQFIGCLLKAIPFYKDIQVSNVCIFYQIVPHNLDLNIQNKHEKRNLQQIIFIHGSNMRSLVRNMYKISQFRQTITSAQTLNTIMIIGYFKLNQNISGTQYLPVITIGVFSEYYNFLNLYMKSITIAELKYIHDTDNKIKQQSQTISNFQNKWISLGIVYSKTSSQAKLVYTDSNSKLASSSIMTSAILPSTISTFDVCISCTIDGGVFGHFDGPVSSVKIIYDIDFSSTDTYYFYNEMTQISKTTILSASFNQNTYIPNSEYDVGKGFNCNTGYTFFEGVCIDQNNCKSLIQDQDIYSSFETGKFYDSTSNKCLNCSSNCLQCSQFSVCTTCRPSYKITNGQCIRCDDANSCNNSCPQKFDPMNQVCVDTFSPSTQHLFDPLLSSRFITDNSDVNVVASPPFSSFNEQIVHCYIDSDNNPMTLYSFLGGSSFTTSTVIKKSYNQIPKGYQKTISFYALFYGSGDPSNLQIKVNSNIVTLDNSYKTIALNQIACSGSGSQTQSFYIVKFIISDYQNFLDLEIQSTSSQWGIRNLDIEISKCHPTCDSCRAGGSVDDCTTCHSNLTQNKFQCMCPYGLFAKYSNCFDSTCVVCSLCSISNCFKCEDITGSCTQCNQGYSIKDGQCVQSSSCNTDDDFVYFSYCSVRKEAGLTHFKQDRIVQYADYWKFYNNNVLAYSCITRKCTPIIGQSHYHALSITLPNYYSYHYQLNVSIEIFLFQSLDSVDYVSLSDNGNVIFSHSYGVEKQQIMGGEIYSDYMFKAEFSYLKSNDQLTLRFNSMTNEIISNEAQSNSEMIISYSRCHPMCKTCTDNTASTCISCIDNSSVGSGSNCECYEGYYFSLIRFPPPNSFPGQCLKCNSVCKKCTGPSSQDCIQCQDGYEIVNNLCKYICQSGNYFDKISQTCLSCHACCKTCDGDQNKNCHDCQSGYFLNRIDKSCSIFNAVCQSCTIAVNSLCGGSQNKNDDCLNNGWVVKDANTCVQCGQFVNGKCVGEYSQNIITFCNQLGFLFNYDNNNCSSCQILISGTSITDGKCGRTEITDRCNNYGWRLFDDNTCIDCNPNSTSYSKCVCHSTCATCSRYQNPLYCETCLPSLFLFKNQCLSKCPNGYTNQGQSCVPCTDQQIPKCVSCYRTCLICNPFQIDSNSSSCTACSPTRKLVIGQCKCLDSDDTRETFQECSYQNIAVLTAILSNSAPLLTINFGKQLNIPINFQIDEFSESLCKYLFTDQTIKLIGESSECQISGKYITVKLGKIFFFIYYLNYSFYILKIKVNSDIFNEDLIYFQKNKLSFFSQNQALILIDTYLNNMVVQTQITGQTKVQFDYVSVENSCNDISIKQKNIVNHAQRGFKSYQWSLKSYLPENPILQQVLENLIQKANSEKKLDLIITKGLIKPNVKVIIKFDFTIKANVISYEELNLSVKPEKKIFLDVQSSILIPFYKYQSAILLITSIVKICDPEGDYLINEPMNFSISSLEYPDKNYSNPSYEKQEYQIEFQPYTLNPGTIILKINAKLVSNLFVESLIDFEIDILASQLYVKIVGGNGYFNYKKQVIIKAKLRDYDIQNEADPQGFDIQWKCVDPATQDTCISKDQKPVIFPSQIPSATIEEFTFNPYIVIKLKLIGSKSQNRQSTDAITVMFSEIDLPPLVVEIQTNDPKMETINLNEMIFVKLDYSTQVNVDLLSYSGTIQYENKVVGIIKFDYTSLRFQVWNYFSEFKRNSIQFQIRFNVFNPQYFMPSIFTSTLNINFPPNNCKFSVTPTVGDSVETKFVLQFQECEDENKPIYYQFFYYQSSDEFEFEKKNPLQVKRRQLNDKSQNYLIESILPSGQILVLAQAIDSKNAIYNTTLLINVQLKVYNELSYVSMIQQKLDQANKLQAGNLISDLSIICDDILKREELKSSSSLNSKKIEILNILNTLQKDLSSLSSFSTVVNKAIASLTLSGITQSESEQKNLLTQLMDSLDESSNLSKANIELSKEKLKQKLFDSFQVVDTFENSNTNIQSSDKIIELTDKIGEYLFKNILPNEDPIYFQGKQTKIFGTQMTEKYVCTYFLCEGTIEPDGTKQASIYNFKKSEQSISLYSQDDSLKEYTNSLKESDPDIQILNYPIITPVISTQQNQKIESFPNPTILSFPITQASISKNMTCISKKKDKGWSKSGCQNYFQQKLNQYLCICDDPSSTTIIDDLESLLYNKNVQTALSTDGIENILNFDNFYKYVAFWLLSFKTILFIVFYYKGYKLDFLDSAQKTGKINSFNIFEQNYIQKPNYNKNQVVPQKQIENDIEENNKLKQVKYDTLQTEGLNYINTSPIINQQETKINNLNTYLNSKNEISNHLNVSYNGNKNTKGQTQKSDENKTTLNITPQTTPLTQILETEQFNNEDQMFDLNQGLPPKTKDPNQISLKTIPIKYSNKKINDQNENQIQDYEINSIKNSTFNFKKNLERQSTNFYIQHQFDFKNLPRYKQILIFHNFFGIFLLFNPEIPRSLRFLIFYVRSIHSLAIAIIFDQNYSLIQKLVVSTFNALSVIVVVKILELAFSCKNVFGKAAGKIITLVVIFGYYYIILSIVSGQEPIEANKFILTFILFFFSDILIFSFCFAVIQLFIAQYILKSHMLYGFKKTLYQFIQLKLILVSLVR